MIRFTATAAAAGMLLAACSGTGGETPADTDAPTDAAPTEGSSEAPAGSGETLIVYTNSNADGRAEWLTEQAAEAGFTIQVVGQGGGDTTNKILAEANNPVADVVFGLNHMYFSQLVAADTIEPYTPAWSGEVDESFADPSGEGNFWPLVQQGIVLAYNADAWSEDEAPSDWIDLWNEPQYEGRYETVSGLGGATTQLIFAGILTRYQDPDGDLGVSDEGWEQIQGYFEKGSPSVPDTDLYARMAAGDVDAGQMFTSGIPSREEQYGVETGVVMPDFGVPFAVEQIAVVKGTEKADEVHAFIDWFGSADTQAAWSAEFDSMPVNQGAIEQADPEIVEFHEGLEQQEIDWDFVTENISSWIEKVELEYVL